VAGHDVLNQSSKGTTVKLRSKAVIAGASALAVVTGTALALTIGSASGSTTLQLDEPNKLGTLAFLDSGGNPITSGSVSSPIATTVRGSVALRSGDTQASLFVYSPTDSATPSAPATLAAFANSPTYPGAWSGQLISTSSYSGSQPEVTVGTSGVLTVAAIASVFPHSGDSSLAQGLYEFRLRTGSASAGITPTYDAAYIKISGTTWSVVDPSTLTGGGTSTPPPVTKTTPAVAVAPSTAKPVYGKGFSVTVTVTGSGSTPTGTVALTTGGKTLVSSNLSGGRAVLAVGKTTLGAGAHSLSVSYSGSAAFNAASGTTTVTIAKQTPKPILTLAKKKVKTSAKPKVTVKISATGLTFTGSVKIYDGRKLLKIVTLTSKNKGKINVTLGRFKAGTHKLKVSTVATANLAAGTSKIVSLKVVR
jgi:hypothetical protein